MRFNGATVFQPWRPTLTRDSLLTAVCWCFNGATVFQPWRPAPTWRRPWCPSPAVSMEPRFFNHGDIDHAYLTGRYGGRVSMEPRFFNHGDIYPDMDAVLVHNNAVSMEPRFFNHGDQTRDEIASGMKPPSFNGATVFQPWRQRSVRPGPQRRGRVSMEPRFFNHGDL